MVTVLMAPLPFAGSPFGANGDKSIRGLAEGESGKVMTFRTLPDHSKTKAT
ncbi:hypothetical protein GCM10011317_02730 [Niveispirillum cyanobacteriorum]|nr:hypothetical protein GCM10011317_02730 [Niveispirillum cyanobacteriorum]